SSTIRVYLPAGSESSPTNLHVMGYFPEENSWKLIPSNFGTESGTHYLTVDVLKLGSFVIVKSATADNSMFSPEGGVQMCGALDLNFYILTVKSATFLEPGIGSFIAGGMIGRTFVSPNIPGSPFPSDFCRGIVPPGTYEFWVSV